MLDSNADIHFEIMARASWLLCSVLLTLFTLQNIDSSQNNDEDHYDYDLYLQYLELEVIDHCETIVLNRNHFCSKWRLGKTDDDGMGRHDDDGGSVDEGSNHSGTTRDSYHHNSTTLTMSTASRAETTNRDSRQTLRTLRIDVNKPVWDTYVHELSGRRPLIPDHDEVLLYFREKINSSEYLPRLLEADGLGRIYKLLCFMVFPVTYSSDRDCMNADFGMLC